MGTNEYYEMLNYPFLDAKMIMNILGPTCKQKVAYKIIHELRTACDENGNLLIDPKRMPPTERLIVPTEIFCKRYGIKRPRRR